MEHIRQYDWCSSSTDNGYFLAEKDLDNCVTEQILRNKFFNPLLSSDSEEDNEKEKLDWDQIFSRKNHGDSVHRVYVPGIRQMPPFLKQSTLTPQQQYQCLKVMCADNPNILPEEFIPRPTKQDHKLFQQVQEIYLKEQQEFREWAQTVWTNGQCIRALRPKPVVEMVYEAEFKMRAHQMASFSKIYEVVAQIPLETKNKDCELVLQKELIHVDVSQLPQLQYSERIQKRISIIRPCSVPEPCVKHPVRFILPNENYTSILPLTEVHRELAQYALDNGVNIIASEKALKCLVERDRLWTIPVSVCQVMGPDGETGNVVVLGSEFANRRENVFTRTYRAYRHLLEFALVPQTEMAKMIKIFGEQIKETKEGNDNQQKENIWMENDDDNDDEDDNLFIDTDDDMQSSITSVDKEMTIEEPNEPETDRNTKEINEEQSAEQNDNVQEKAISENIGVYICTCKDSMFQKPPPRSYRKWQVRSNSASEHYDIIVHCGHKNRDESSEMIVEPIPEYQIDMGATKQSDDTLRTLALSLALRKNASVLNVRIDTQSGDIVTFSKVSGAQFSSRHAEHLSVASGVIHAALDQLQGLVPGHYVIMHEPSHGANALLYAPRNTGDENQLTLDFDSSQLAQADEAKSVQTPPVLAPELLPWHKFRKILPCAFTPNKNQVVKEAKKPPAKQKTPPQALRLRGDGENGARRGKWPKRKSRKRKSS